MIQNSLRGLRFNRQLRGVSLDYGSQGPCQEPSWLGHERAPQNRLQIRSKSEIKSSTGEVLTKKVLNQAIGHYDGEDPQSSSVGNRMTYGFLVEEFVFNAPVVMCDMLFQKNFCQLIKYLMNLLSRKNYSKNVNSEWQVQDHGLHQLQRNQRQKRKKMMTRKTFPR